MIDKPKVKELLKRWDISIEVAECASKRKAEENTSGLMGRIKRTKGKPVIFDLESHENQNEIKNSLCEELPQWSDLIRSEPEIMDGYNWTRKDFIDLYFEHFRMVIQKLEKIISQ
jgi:hypothetical protein